MKYSLLLVLLMLSGCVAQPSVTSWLDPVSVATITSQTEPLMLSRGAPSSRVKRSFAQLSAIEINRMGTRRLYLVVIPRIAAELTPKQQASFERSFDRIEIRVAERSIPLDRYEGELAELGIGQPELLPLSGVPVIYYPIQRAELRAMATSEKFELAALGLSSPRVYEEWTQRSSSLRDFYSQLPADPSESRASGAP